MIAGIPNDLGRRIKPHRLGVEQRAAEDIRMMAFEPGRSICNQRKGGGMAFGKAVATEAFKLFERLLGKLALIAIGDHAVDAPFWVDVAPTVLRPPGSLLALAGHRASFEQRYCTPRLTGAASWICTWKCALRLWPDLPRFSNQMLRYQRMPEGLVHQIGLPAHRGMPDAYVTAFHLRDMLNQVEVAKLIQWSDGPGLLPRIPAGPERGKTWDRVSQDVLEELARDRDLDVRFSAGTELRRRGEMPDAISDEPIQRSLF